MQIFTILLVLCLVILKGYDCIVEENTWNGTTTKKARPIRLYDVWDKNGIPITYDYYSTYAKRLVMVVRQGIKFVEDRSCLKFREENPMELAKLSNLTYLMFTYSGVLEDCCLPFFSKLYGRRMVLITPSCIAPHEIAHAILHGVGLKHRSATQSFDPKLTKSILFQHNCEDYDKNLRNFDSL